jgi:hypothetical protein
MGRSERPGIINRESRRGKELKDLNKNIMAFLKRINYKIILNIGSS